jgi:P-type E1-E2 ATPase
MMPACIHIYSYFDISLPTDGSIRFEKTFAVNDYQKESQFRELSQANDDIMALIMRSGKAKQINVGDIVVGDIVCVEAGDQIPCDGI